MKRALFVVPVLALGVLVLLLLDARSNSTSTTLEAPALDEPATAEPVDDFEIAEPLTDDAEPLADDPIVGQPLPPAEARAASVRFVSDGDSFDITWSDTGERDEVRLIGINAPEGDACFGDEARDVLRSLIEGESLLIHVSYRDEFGRVLGDAWVGTLHVNATMIEVGGAVALTDASIYRETLGVAQQVAQDTSAGLWDPELCGGDPSVQIVISDINSDAAGRDDENPNGEWIDVLNLGVDVVDLSAWSIRDESTRHRFTFPDGYALAPNELVRIFSGCGADADFDLYWCDGDPIWNNGGDTGFLVDAEGLFVDTYVYGG